MKIAIVNWSLRKLGGAESYLDAIIPALLDHGHSLAMLCESDVPPDRPPLSLPRDVPLFRTDIMGIDRALAGLTDWQPDVLYNHGLTSSELESRMLQIAPAVIFAHGYLGTCISGEKALKLPTQRPCPHQFGWQCLLRYYPRRCGGLNPSTMWKLYNQEARRLSLMHEYAAIVTASDYMRREFIRHGFPPAQVHAIRSPIAFSKIDETETAPGSSASLRVEDPDERRLLFLGRMTDLKGGTVMLDALPQVVQLLPCQIRAMFVGDGPARTVWQARARRLQSRNRSLSVEFNGWLDGKPLADAIDRCDLLVMPSVWPEPFGRSGPEAGLRGIPAVAFAVGGIPEWLTDGINGHLAPADPPTSSGLAAAIVKALRLPDHYESLRRGARERSLSFGLNTHIASLIEILETSRATPRTAA
jgi:glycosyltransferase involved in cell wall biosynthesis